MKCSNWMATAAFAGVLSIAPATKADVITDWNDVINQTIRDTGGPPGPPSRTAAMMNIAMFDSINSISDEHQPIIINVNVTQNTSARAAAAAAAHRVLSNNYPQFAARYDADLANSLASLPAGAARDRGVNLGRLVADAVIQNRANDGFDASPAYTFENRPGMYFIDDPDLFAAPAHPHWGRVRPFAMTRSAQFRPSGPAGFRKMQRLIESAAYAAQLNEVKELGSRTSTTRTQEQTDIAWFWANDRNGTYKPPGHLLDITKVIANQEGLDFYKKSRLFALVSAAMHDAAVCAWDCKYNSWCDLWRPEAGIRNADIDNNPATVKDATWEPLSDFTPPFPAYTSGHATFGACHAAVLRNYFKTDNLTFTITTDEPFYTGGPRTYTSFTQAARDNALSRLYLGVHWRFDGDAGYSSGTLVGNNVFDKLAKPICSADVNNDGVVNSTDLYDFTDGFLNAQVDLSDFDKNGIVNFSDYFEYIDAYTNGCN